MKKVVKISVSILILSIITLVTIPYFFKEEIKAKVMTELNNSIDATITIDAVSINLLSSFPNAKIELEETLIKNNAPFENDTLVFLKSVIIKTSIGNVISQNLSLDNFSVSNGRISLKTNKDNISNYDIVKASETPKEVNEDQNASSISLHIENYSFNNIDFNYLDETSNLVVNVENFNHNGTGVFSSQHVALNTNSSIEKFSFGSEGVHYLNEAKITWEALLDINLDNLKVSFKENMAHLNDLNLSFDGFVQPVEEGILMDVDFDSKNSEFKSLLSLIPSAYSSDFEHISASGALDFKGKATGVYAENEIPKFDLFINTENASFKYPDLPKGIDKITINTKIENKTGVIDDTRVSINKFNFQIDEDEFKASSILTHLTSDPHVNTSLQGVMNLGNLSQAYPMQLEEKIEGVLRFNIKTSFTQNAVEKELYEQIKNNGSLSISNMLVTTEMLPNPISIHNAYLKFTPKNFVLEKFEATTAKSDLSIKGTLHNLVGFVFGDKDLKGNFNIVSKNINTFDLLSSEDIETNSEIDTKTPTSAIKIPEKIDITANLKAEKVSYDNIHLEDLKGVLKIKNQQVVFKNTTAKMLGGTIQLIGKVDTKPTPSNFDFNMSMKELDIIKSFETIELFSSIAPFAQVLNGKISTSLDLSGLLDNDFFPDLNSLDGKGNSLLLVKEIDAKKSNAMSLINDNFNLIDLSKLDMKKIQAAVKFENSQVSFAPFKIASYNGTPIQFNGSHSFDNKMNYSLSADIPAQLLGREATSLLSSLTEEDTKDMTVPLTIKIDGDLTSPKITPDYKSAMTALSSKVVDSQKNKLLNSLFKNNNKQGDTTKTEGNELEKAASKLLKGLFN